MSSQKGNTVRSRPQKHKNRSGFKNDLHDTNHRTKMINSTQVHDVCVRCKDIIEWKIKYKKYKPLTQPKTCVKCNLKTVKQAYHVMCGDCGKKYGQCTKCCQSKELILPSKPKTEHELDLELKSILTGLPERRRRTFLRYMDKKRKENELETEKQTTDEEDRKDLLDKLVSLKMKDDTDYEDDNDEDDNDFDYEELENDNSK